MLPFEDSRRLTGANLFFASTGAVLEVGTAIANDDAVLAGWRTRVERVGAHLGWATRQSVIRRHAAGASLAVAAPYDGLFLATEVDEWAVCAALAERDPSQSAGLEAALAAAAAEAAADDPENPAAALPPVIGESAALARFTRLADLERRPRLRALLDMAAVRGLPHLLDETELTLGAGTGGRGFPLAALPQADAVPWGQLSNIPTVLVTGSNGKTTTVRLLAACAAANGWRAGYSCTDGVFLERASHDDPSFDDEELASGDYSGPAGARRVLRDARVQAAVLETARGGILRRGIAVSTADAAVITNVSSDHFGEYGIDDLAGLADVKLTVAAVVAPDGLLVLNAEDPLLSTKAGTLAKRFGRCPPLGWFALDADHPTLRAHAARGAAACGVRHGRLWLDHDGRAHDLGLIGAMPLTIGGAATYNVANLAAAALAAIALGIRAPLIAEVFARFGATPDDNPGRMMRFELGGVRILIDYAHNPDGLRGFLTVAEHLRAGTGRLGLLLGHAGNRKDDDFEGLARVAATFRPDLVVVKENEAQLRGRAPGDIPRIIRAELERLGLPGSALPVAGSELEAVKCALDWARPGDLLALPVHSAAARAAVLALLHERSATATAPPDQSQPHPGSAGAAP